MQVVNEPGARPSIARRRRAEARTRSHGPSLSSRSQAPRLLERLPEHVIEAAATASGFSDGVHVIGTRIEPGVHTTPGGGFCYCTWEPGSGSDAHIVGDNSVNGPTTPTLDAGDVFE